jgi:hypothetical protein
MMKSFSCNPLIFLVLQRNGRATRAETDIGVMAFALGELADLLHEGKRFPKIVESKCALDAAGLHRAAPNRESAL